MSNFSALPSTNRRQRARQERADPLRTAMLQRSGLITQLVQKPNDASLRQKMTQCEELIFSTSEEQKSKGKLQADWSINYQFFDPPAAAKAAMAAQREKQQQQQQKQQQQKTAAMTNSVFGKKGAVQKT